MLERCWRLIASALGLGLESREINIFQMSLRALVVFILAIAMLRIGDKRFMGKSTALDVMLGIVFGSVVSRAITGNAPFFPTLAAAVVLVALHWIFSALAFRSHKIGSLFKGHHRPLVVDGKINWDEMKSAHISEHDLHEAMRLSGSCADVRNVKSAHLERNGEISILMHDS
jgi:uncharacterized membrane protein YcaP (DUF421 family)